MGFRVSGIGSKYTKNRVLRPKYYNKWAPMIWVLGPLGGRVQVTLGTVTCLPPEADAMRLPALNTLERDKGFKGLGRYMGVI